MKSNYRWKLEINLRQKINLKLETRGSSDHERQKKIEILWPKTWGFIKFEAMTDTKVFPSLLTTELMSLVGSSKNSMISVRKSGAVNVFSVLTLILLL